MPRRAPLPPSMPKYRAVEGQLATRIRAGAYDVGGLPPERELAASFGVARVTVRKALEGLQSRGLVLRRARSATLVTSASAGLHRRLLPGHIDGFLDRGRIDKRRVLRFERMAASPDIADALGLATGSPLFKIVRVRSADGVPLLFTEAYVNVAVAPQLTRAALGRWSMLHVLEHECGVRIATAEQRLTAEAATSQVAAALDVPRSAPVVKVERVIRDDRGVPVQLLLGWYRADRFGFRMQLSRADDSTRVWVEHVTPPVGALKSR